MLKWVRIIRARIVFHFVALFALQKLHYIKQMLLRALLYRKSSVQHDVDIENVTLNLVQGLKKDVEMNLRDSETSSEWRRVGNDAERHNEVEDFWKPSWFFFLWFGFFLFECAKQKERNEQGKDAGMRLIDAEINSAWRGDSETSSEWRDFYNVTLNLFQGLKFRS